MAVEVCFWQVTKVVEPCGVGRPSGCEVTKVGIEIWRRGRVKVFVGGRWAVPTLLGRRGGLPKGMWLPYRVPESKRTPIFQRNLVRGRTPTSHVPQSEEVRKRLEICVVDGER